MGKNELIDTILGIFNLKENSLHEKEARRIEFKGKEDEFGPDTLASLTLETLAIFCNVKPWEGGWIPPPPPINNAFRAVLGQFFYTILEIYINEEPMQKIGSPAFIFWLGGPLELSYLEPV